MCNLNVSHDLLCECRHWEMLLHKHRSSSIKGLLLLLILEFLDTRVTRVTTGAQ